MFALRRLSLRIIGRYLKRVIASRAVDRINRASRNAVGRVAARIAAWRNPGDPENATALPRAARLIAVHHPNAPLPERPYDLILLAATAGALAGIERIDTGAGSDVLRGSATADTIDLSAVTVVSLERIEGAAGNDTLIGSAGDDALFGGAGNDTFVLRADAGHDTVGDFRLGTRAVPLADVVDISAWGYHSLAEVMAHTSVVSGNAVITYNATTSVTLTGILPSQFHVDDFKYA